jgi:hypothetical protein
MIKNFSLIVTGRSVNGTDTNTDTYSKHISKFKIKSNLSEYGYRADNLRIRIRIWMQNK